MKLMFLIGLLLASWAAVFAQGDVPGCNLYVTAKDDNCSGTTTCAQADRCETVPFRVVCANAYWIKAQTDCGQTHCAHCASCVYIYTDPPGPNYVKFVSTTDVCDDADCCKFDTWTPAAGNYLLKVCLIPCNEVDEETCCSGICTAWGYVSSQSLSCQ